MLVSSVVFFFPTQLHIFMNADRYKNKYQDGPIPGTTLIDSGKHEPNLVDLFLVSTLAHRTEKTQQSADRG